MNEQSHPPLAVADASRRSQTRHGADLRGDHADRPHRTAPSHMRPTVGAAQTPHATLATVVRLMPDGQPTGAWCTRHALLLAESDILSGTETRMRPIPHAPAVTS